MAAADGTVALTPGSAGGRLGLTSLLCCRDRFGRGAPIWDGLGFGLDGDESREEKGEAVEGELDTFRDRATFEDFAAADEPFSDGERGVWPLFAGRVPEEAAVAEGGSPLDGWTRLLRSSSALASREPSSLSVMLYYG